MTFNPREGIRESFLRYQQDAIMELAAHSDVVEVLGGGPVGSLPPSVHLLRFHCRGLIKTPAGIAEAVRHDAAISFAEDYQRRVDPAELVTMLWPPNIFHPNVRPPFVCLGDVRPGTDLTDLVYRLYELLTYHNFTMHEATALNGEACAWARRHQDRFPLERRPLRRRPLALGIRPAPAGGPGETGEQEKETKHGSGRASLG